MTHGDFHTRKEISEKLGGSRIPFAPMKNGKVTYICLDPERNPDAPEIVFIKTAKGIERMKNQVIAQKGPFPTFVKRKVNQWEFVGEFFVAKYSNDSKTIDEYYTPCKTPSDQVTALILLKSNKRFGIRN